MSDLTIHHCPGCNKPLRVATDEGRYLVYCANGFCPSPVTNDGAEATSIAQAATALAERADFAAAA
jgi:hypothetical protein